MPPEGSQYTSLLLLLPLIMLAWLMVRVVIWRIRRRRKKREENKIYQAYLVDDPDNPYAPPGL